MTQQMSAPARSQAQRMEALEHANKIRVARANLKKDIKTGRVSIFDVLAEPPWWLGTAKIMDLLLAVPSFGRVKTNKILTRCRISPSKTIGGMTYRQRAELLSWLRR